MRISGRRIRQSAGRLSSKDDNQTRRCRNLQVFLITVFCLCILVLSINVLNSSKYCRPVLLIRIRIILVTWIRTPDPHQIKSISGIASNKKKDLDPHQSDKLDSEPDPYPQQFADLPKCVGYEPVWALFKVWAFLWKLGSGSWSGSLLTWCGSTTLK